jgi:glycosyltransferase involved in cell wall biosynthesis
VLVADDDEAFAQSIVHLLRDREARQRLSAAGRKLVESHFSPAATIPQVEQLYSTVLNGGIPAGRTQ